MTAMTRLTSKGTVFALVLTGASVILVSGSREWVSGSVDDAVLGAGALHGRGSDIAPAVMAAALVGLASAVVAATSGTVLRVVAACAALLAAVLGATLVIAVLADPNAALGRLAAASTGRSGTLAAHGRVGGWAWAALAAMLVMGMGALGSMVGARRWRGLPSRYDAVEGRRDPGEARAGHALAASEASTVSPASEAPGASPASQWDQLSRGDDPTAEPDC
jgi:uncharacterized membrane protein (TIGR02234 family)